MSPETLALTLGASGLLLWLALSGLHDALCARWTWREASRGVGPLCVPERAQGGGYVVVTLNPAPEGRVPLEWGDGYDGPTQPFLASTRAAEVWPQTPQS